LKKALLLVFLCLLVSCTKSVKPAVSLSDEDWDVYSQEAVDMMNCVTMDGGYTGTPNDCIKDKKMQVLEVQSYTIRTDHFRYYDQKEYTSETVIQLDGTAMRSTAIKKAYLKFVDKEGLLATPRYDTIKGILHMQLRTNQLEGVLASLKDDHSQLICIYGEGNDGKFAQLYKTVTFSKDRSAAKE
jgi:hypothetical protein